jgi:LysM repeat protein
VQSGDTLSGIAAKEGVSDWHTLYTNNESTIGSNANLIYPGQVLNLG